MNLAKQKFLDVHEQRVQHSIQNCILAHQHFAELPEHVSLADMLFVLDNKDEPKGALKRFVLQYAPSTSKIEPLGCSVEHMMLELKRRIKNKPKEYTQATKSLQTGSFVGNIAKSLSYQKKYLKSIKQMLDRQPPVTQTLYFCGEHAVHPTIEQQWKILQKTTKQIEFLGGLSVNSGFDFYAQGDFEEALEQWNTLFSIIKKTQAKNIIAPSAATYFTLTMLKDLYPIQYDVYTLPQWIATHPVETQTLPKALSIYHNTALTNMSKHSIPKVLGTQMRIKNIDKHLAYPINEYNYNYAKKNNTMHHNLIAEAHRFAPILVVDCTNTANILQQSVTKENNVTIVDIATFYAMHTQEDE